MPATDKSALAPAVCRCGYRGKSRRPKHYQCGYCYYMNWSIGIAARAAKLRERSAKLEREVRDARAKAAAFRKRHPEAGPLVTGDSSDD